MRALGHYILSGRLQAIGLISFLTIISLLFPALAYLMSGVPVALVTLRRGAMIGMQVVMGSLLLTTLLTLLIPIIVPQLAITFAVGIWVPIWLCSLVLRTTQSQGLLVLTAGAVGMLFIVLMHALLGDLTSWWQAWFEVWVETNFPANTAEQYKELFENAVPLMNAMMAAGVVISLILAALIARWWQASLFNPGEFRKEFYSLDLPRMLCYPTLIGTIILLLGKDLELAILRDLLIVIVFLYLFQGLSTIHRAIRWRGLSHTWLVVTYACLFLIPQMVLFMACVGMADSWLSGGKKNS